MSAETMQWLNLNTLIGFTEKRGTAWHYRAECQGEESNHYPGAIPVEDVQRRLFHWQAVEGDLTSTYVEVTEDGVTEHKITDPTRKGILRPVGAFGPDDPGAVLGTFKQGYQIHQYTEWLLHNVATMLDADLQVSSAVLLKGGAVAAVQVEMPDTLETPEGVAFRPFLLSATSLDGSLASTYQTGAQVVVCDNTLSAALGETDALRIKIKHSAKSLKRISEARDALGIVYSVADDFAAEVAALCKIDVSDKQYGQVVEHYAPIVGKEAGRGLTLAQNKQDTLMRLWRNDTRVTPWKGTAFGVVQAFNTYNHHESNVRGAERAERNALRAITGETHKADAEVLAVLHKVLADA